MIACDSYVVEFIQGNWLTLVLVLGILKLLATETKTTLDNKILTLVEGWLGGLRGKSPKPEDEE